MIKIINNKQEIVFNRKTAYADLYSYFTDERIRIQSTPADWKPEFIGRQNDCHLASEIQDNAIFSTSGTLDKERVINNRLKVIIVKSVVARKHIRDDNFIKCL